MSAAPVAPIRQRPARLLNCIALGSVLGFAVAWRCDAADEEPVYQGEKFGRLIETKLPERIATAALELGLDKTLPYLLDALGDRESVWDKAKLEGWKHLPLSVQTKYRTSMPFPADSTRIKALLSLGEIGLEAQAAVPAMIDLLAAETNQAVRQWRLAALSHIGAESSEAITALEKAIHDPDPSIHREALSGLAYIGPKAVSAVPAVVEEIRHPTAGRTGGVSPFAFEALGRMGPAASNALPVLLDVLRSGSNTQGALLATRGLGPAAAPAIPFLSQAIEARKPGYPYAIETVCNIGPPARPCLPLLESLLADTNPVVRILAAAAVARIGGLHEKAVQVLVTELEGSKRSRLALWSPPVSLSEIFGPRPTAAWFLGELGPDARSAVPVLTKTMSSASTSFRVLAARALWRIEGKSGELVPVLAEAVRPVKGSSDAEQTLAAMTLAEMGPAAKPAVPQLEEARVYGSRVLRREAVLALRQIRGSPGAAPGR